MEEYSKQGGSKMEEYSKQAVSWRSTAKQAVSSRNAEE
jgi:hypothetical protein